MGLIVHPYNYSESVQLIYSETVPNNAEEEDINYSNAFDWFTTAANKGHPDANYRLGLIYEKGEDLDKAEEHYKKAAKLYTKDLDNAAKLYIKELTL